MGTPYQDHVVKWEGCRRCVLAKQRSRVVIARGKIPCTVLLLGEAPGQSEDVLGLPFVGPAGQLLDKIVREAMPLRYDDGPDSPSTGERWRTCFTNVVACFPREAKATTDHAPPLEAIKACSARVREFVAIARPRLVVCVGALATKYVHLGVDTAGGVKVVSIQHPAAILRMPWAQKGMAANRCVATLETAFLELEDADAAK